MKSRFLGWFSFFCLMLCAGAAPLIGAATVFKDGLVVVGGPVGVGLSVPAVALPTLRVGGARGITLLADDPSVGFNLHWNGSWVYDATTEAMLLTNQVGSGLVFASAPSGTAGTTATMTNRLKVYSTGVTIGPSGTAISNSIRGTVSWTPGTLNNNCVQTSFTVSGAISGAECGYGWPSQPGNNLTLTCAIASNSCQLTMCNNTAVGTSAPSGTYSCRAWNP